MSCPACIQGSLDEGQPRGEELTLADVPCYLSNPATAAGSQPKKAIILGSDVFGYKLPNLRLIADVFADNGYLAVAPDYLQGSPVDMQYLLLGESVLNQKFLLSKILGVLRMVWVYLTVVKPWASRHPGDHPVQVVQDLAGVLRQQYGVEKVVYQGYCYGGKVGLLLAAKPGVVNAISIAHPGGVEDSDLTSIQVPILMCCAGTDPLFPAKMVRRARQVLEQKHQESGLLSKVVQHAGTQHGYAVRASKTDKVAQDARKDALKQALDFFKQALGYATLEEEPLES